ncbi:MAG: DUF4124 domain-containing protein [Nitrosomonas sp.]|nr:DUF4124 domain-containing protein [Nitrosomonas sp.]
MKLNYLLFAALLSQSCLVFSGVYKHVDEHGNTTYSNVPSQGAKPVDLPPIVVVPAIDAGDIDKRMQKRRESAKIKDQREAIENKISEESSRLDEIRNEYKGGTPDRLGSERNYQRYLDRVERLKKEISTREDNLFTLKNELQNLPDIK